MLEALVDTILPRTDTPGAREARVQVFVDLALRDCYTARRATSLHRRPRSARRAAKELTEAGLRTLELERGRPVEHVKDYETALLDPWDLPYGNMPTQHDLLDYPCSGSCPSCSART